MLLFSKILMALLLTAAVGAGSYEACQNVRLRAQVQKLESGQAPLQDQIQQWQVRRDEATSRLAALRVENAQLKSNSPLAERQQLLAEIARLQAAADEEQADPTNSAVNSWLYRVNQLKTYVAQHPEATTPEFQYLTAREWLLMALTDESATGWSAAIQSLEFQAVGRFGEVVATALQKYAQAHAGQFPTDLAQLQPDCDAQVEEILQARYEIKPASALPASFVKDQYVKFDWVITTKNPSGNRIAIYPQGYSYY